MKSECLRAATRLPLAPTSLASRAKSKDHKKSAKRRSAALPPLHFCSPFPSFSLVASRECSREISYNYPRSRRHDMFHDCYAAQHPRKEGERERESGGASLATLDERVRG